MIPPGVDCAKWCFDRAVPRKGAVRFLFVGGDFVRKGGPLLVEAFKTVRDVVPGCVLDIVTMSHVVTSAEGITVHNGLKPNTPDLMRLYSNADVFVFPTRGDCFPLAVLEALSSGLPVITSDIGAIREAVIPNQGGLVVAVDDKRATSEAMIRLAQDVDLRMAMSHNARETVVDRYDARVNYPRLLRYIGGEGT
jgi:glycosyltransferase involved in cell wall biosynthesis